MEFGHGSRAATGRCGRGRGRLRTGLVAGLAVLAAAAARPLDGAGDAPVAKAGEKPVVLAALGGGDAKTLAEAWALVPDGGTIVVRAGVYEQIVPTKSVSIVSERPERAAAFQSRGLPAVAMLTPYRVTLKGLTLRSPAEGDGKTSSAAVVHSSGTLVLEECTVEGEVPVGIAVTGATTEFRAKAVSLRAGGATGLSVTDGASAEFEGGDVLRTSVAGVHASQTGSKLSLKGVRMVGHLGTGVEVLEGAKATFDGVRFENGKGPQLVALGAGTSMAARGLVVIGGGDLGATVEAGASASFDRCEISGSFKTGVRANGQDTTVSWRGGSSSKNLGSGFLVEERASVTIEDAVIESNTYVGAEFRGQSKGTVRRSKLHHQVKGGGVTVHEQSEVRVEDSDLWGNTGDNLICFAGGVLDVRKSKSHESTSSGASATEKGRMVLADCELWANAESGVYVNDAEVVVQRCVVRDERKIAVTGTKNAKLILESCEIRGATETSLHVDASEASLTATKILDGRNWGVYALHGGRVRMTGGEVSVHGAGGLYVDEGGEAVFKDVKFRRNRGFGVQAVAGSKGTFDGCDLSTNVLGAWSLAEPTSFVRKGNKPNK